MLTEVERSVALHKGADIQFECAVKNGFLMISYGRKTPLIDDLAVIACRGSLARAAAAHTHRVVAAAIYAHDAEVSHRMTLGNVIISLLYYHSRAKQCNKIKAINNYERFNPECRAASLHWFRSWMAVAPLKLIGNNLVNRPADVCDLNRARADKGRVMQTQADSDGSAAARAYLMLSKWFRAQFPFATSLSIVILTILILYVLGELSLHGLRD